MKEPDTILEIKILQEEKQIAVNYNISGESITLVRLVESLGMTYGMMLLAHNMDLKGTAYGTACFFNAMTSALRKDPEIIDLGTKLELLK